MSVALVVIAVVTAPLVLSDVRSRRLPNRLVAVAAAGVLIGLGTTEAITVGQWAEAARSAASVGISGALTLALFVGFRMLGAVGMGDVKLAAVLASALGLVRSEPDILAGELAVAAASAFLSAGLAVVVLRLTALAGASTRAPPLRSIPFGPFLLLGFWVAVGVTLLG